MVMPRLGGREVYERLQRIRPGLSVCFISGYSPRAVDLDFLMAHKIKLISKPFARVELLRALEELLSAPEDSAKEDS